MTDKHSRPSIIALDGPAASGKSTLGRRLADALGYLFFDTGVMYRAVTWMALQRGLDVRDEAAVTKLAQGAHIEVRPASKEDGRVCDVLIGDKDVTWELRDEAVEANVSVVSAYAGVRKALSSQQRRIGMRGHVVMAGRDIGTEVLPDADLKIYLDAGAAQRAKRRFEELTARGDAANYDEILRKVIERDHIDSTRAVAPLRAASDAHIINSDRMGAEEVFQQVMQLCQ